MSQLQIRKVKYKDERVEITAEQEIGVGDDMKETKLRCSEPPAAEFSRSEDGIEGAVITGFVTLAEADAPFVFNTPHLPFEQYSPTGNAPLMPHEAIEALKRVQLQAEAYLNGKRAQGNLFGEAA